MTPETYLEKLCELKKFLKEHPEQKLIYCDVPVDFLILETKKKIFDKENEHAYDRQPDSDFVPADRIPF